MIAPFRRSAVLGRACWALAAWCGLLACCCAPAVGQEQDIFLVAMTVDPEPDLVPAGWEVEELYDQEPEWQEFTAPQRVLNPPPQTVCQPGRRHHARQLRKDRFRERLAYSGQRVVHYSELFCDAYRQQMDAHHELNRMQSERIPVYLRSAAELLVYGVHDTAEFIVQMPVLWEEALADTWLRTQLDLHHERNRRASEPFDPCLECLGGSLACVWCHFQYHFVNWRHSSVALCGCMPHGYDLWAFIETVPHIEYHAGPLFAGGPIEPGGTELEAALLDGTDARMIAHISLDISPPEGELPEDRAEIMFAAAGKRMHIPGTHRPWHGLTYYWNASLLNHQPLYFEDVNLERHGFSHGICQPLVSGAHFFATLPALPYLAIAQPFAEPVYTLGESRPGSHAPYICELPPLDYEAAVLTAAGVTGMIFLIP